MRFSSFFYIVFATGLGLSACKSKTGEQGECPVIEFSQTDFLDLSPYMDEYRIALMESDPESIFSEPDKMIVHQGKLFILDKTLKAVLCFDTTGKFNYRIQRIGKGPREYVELNAMWVNPETEELWLESYTPGKIMVFGSDGTFRHEFPIEWASRDMARAGNNRIIGYNTTQAVHDQDELGIGLLLMDEEGRLKKPLLNIGSSAWYYALSNRRYLTESDGGLLVISQSDTIYSISPDGKVREDFIADFGKLSMPARLRQLKYSHETSQLFKESRYILGKDQILGFGPIRMFKVYLESKVFFALADLDLLKGSFSMQIRHSSGPVPIFLPECVTDNGELAGLLTRDVMVILRESMSTAPSDPKMKDLNDRALEILNRGISNDRPVIWFAPIKKQWFTQKNNPYENKI
ncbi:MAG: 6-bladed beta-propeller [Bacteroidota bacterium]